MTSGAYGAAERLGAGQGIITAANEAFVSAMHWAVLSTVVAALGVLVVLRWLPGRSDRPQVGPEPASEPDLARVS